MFAHQLCGFVFLALAAIAQANPPCTAGRQPTSSPRRLRPALSKAMTIPAGTTFTPPTAYTRYDRGSGACEGQTEGGDADAVFLLEEGATLSRVVIGANQAEGVHCLGSCTLDHVYFEDVCEDAITIKQTSASAISHINFGGAKNADDKIIQHNGAGTVIINSFYAENFGKVYRSCGNCGTQYKRHVQINDLWAVDVRCSPGSAIAGINTNYGDTATIRTTQVGDVSDICVKYTGNNNGAEPPKIGSGSDSTVSNVIDVALELHSFRIIKNCLYSSSDIKQL
ncbi:pectate lyase-domain-containing protein [Mycena sp. CBHHK59/15]|nr:pectate lyase-domain-containing protein [Mycena sp. CBHHK59/15]